MFEISLDLNVTYSVLRFFISFREAPWYSLVHYMWAITTTWWGSCATYIRFTISKVAVSYKYMSFLRYSEIHLLRFINCYFTSIYNKYINLLGFICPLSQNPAYLTNNNHKTLLITEILNQFLLWYFQMSFFAADTESTTFSKASTFQMQKAQNRRPYRVNI